MMTTPAQHNVQNPPGQHVNPLVLADIINAYDPVTGDRRRPPAKPARDALADLLAAVENEVRGRARLLVATDVGSHAHLQGCVVRLSEAMDGARETLRLTR